jgi:NTP pyrophosphatase (non-canonical NTP hydrolase)
MSDNSSATIGQLTELVLKFREERDWKQFHNPKDQSLSLCLESAELLELMQWRNGPELEAHLANNRERLGEELADVLGWVLLLAHDQKIDLASAFARKIQLNSEKYPVEKARGVATKYTDL